MCKISSRLSTEVCPAPPSPIAIEEDSVQFNKLSYLGCTWVKAPRNEAEAQRAMATLRAESAIPIPITLHVPCGPDGSVRSDTETCLWSNECIGKLLGLIKLEVGSTEKRLTQRL